MGCAYCWAGARTPCVCTQDCGARLTDKSPFVKNCPQMSAAGEGDEPPRNTTAYLHSTTDAAVWAAEFWRLHGGHKLSLDEGTMISWFANAIETGRSAGQGVLGQVIMLATVMDGYLYVAPLGTAPPYGPGDPAWLPFTGLRRMYGQAEKSQGS